MNFKFYILTALLAALIIPSRLVLAGPEAIQIETQAARNFGYTLGDRFKLTAYIDTPLFYSLETGYLPKPGQITHWLELTKLNVDTDIKQHDYVLEFTFQVFRQTRETSSLSIPAIPLRFRYAGETINTAIPAWSFNYSPLLPEVGNIATLPIQPLLPVKPLKQIHGERIFYLLFTLILICLYLLWFYGKLPFLERYNGPFGKACKIIKPQLNRSETEAVYQQILICFHHALDETAGETVLLAKLKLFFKQYPQFQPLQSDTEQLMAYSQQWFFDPHAAKTQRWPVEDILLLCNRYRKIERSGRWL